MHEPDGLGERLQRIEDIEAIRSLLARFGLLADSWDKSVVDLWTSDGVYAVEGFGEATGHEQLADLIFSDIHEQFAAVGCAHILSSPVIDFADDGAFARNYSAVFRNDGDQFTAWRVSINRWHLVRTQNGWRVKRRDNALLNGGDAARALFHL